MRIDFRSSHGMDLDSEFTRCHADQALIGQKAGFWSRVLRELKAESGRNLYDAGFEEWVKDEWTITFLHENNEYPTHITGLDMNDSTFTMVLLKFGNSN